jgi:hypothetical protein
MLEHLYEKLNVLSELASKDHLMVIGVPKSGTTWVQRMLDTHPEIYCPGEGKFEEFIKGFLKTIENYNEVLDFTNRIIYGKDAYYRLWDEANIVAALQCIMALSWASSRHKKLSQVRYVGDKDTINPDAIITWRDKLLKGARFIQVIRDGRDTLVSNVFHHARTHQKPAHFDTPEFYEFLDRYAVSWEQAITTYRKAFEGLPELYHEVLYEDLLVDSEASLKSILVFLEVDSSPEVVAEILKRNQFEKLSGGRKAGLQDNSSFLRKGIAGGWRQHLNKHSRKLFNQRAGAMLAALGYDPV